jgi:2-polyprenyl-3-methyl-5-hydroxy-6-metoxy-1,4-benzoquinol methylase
MPDVNPYYNRVNPDLLALIPPDAKTVLEIGCGAGALCDAYRRVNPGIKWHGIENNHAAVEAARSKGIKIVWEDANWLAEPDLVAAGLYSVKPDVLVLGDILEHLNDPWQILKWCAGIVIPGAQVLACIPNVQHWTVIRDLLRGKWTYTDEGLLDRTHLRFFTLDSIREMFEQAGLQQ